MAHCVSGKLGTKNPSQAIVTDRGPTLIIQVSKSVFKYGIKINAGERITKNYVLHKTGDSIFVILECDFTSAMKPICASYCSEIK